MWLIQIEIYLLATSLFFAGYAFGDGTSERPSIRVYAIDWDVMARARLSADDVRKQRTVYLEIRDEYLVENTVRSISKLKCDHFPSNDQLDVRLVIDVKERNKPLRTLYADRDRLVKSDVMEVCSLTDDLLGSLSAFLMRQVK